MEIRPHRIIKRKITKEIQVGNIKVGGIIIFCGKKVGKNRKKKVDGKK